MNEVEVYILIGARIRALRQSKGLTQQTLADECDMEKPNLSRIENGNTNPTIKSLWKISNALGVKLKDLVDVEDERLDMDVK